MKIVRSKDDNADILAVTHLVIIAPRILALKTIVSSFCRGCLERKQLIKNNTIVE